LAELPYMKRVDRQSRSCPFCVGSLSAIDRKPRAQAVAGIADFGLEMSALHCRCRPRSTRSPRSPAKMGPPARRTTVADIWTRGSEDRLPGSGRHRAATGTDPGLRPTRAHPWPPGRRPARPRGGRPPARVERRNGMAVTRPDCSYSHRSSTADPLVFEVVLRPCEGR
jgi:hypothetical protein